MEKIFVSGPSITEKEIDYVKDAVTNAWYGQANMYHDRFEKTFAEYIGVNYAISLPSCTSGLHLALLALGIGEGDEVIVPEITWIATAAPLKYVAATPVFVDVENDTWCISPESIEKAITKRTKAIIPVDLYGNIPNMDKIWAIAKKYNLHVIEDAAEAIGSLYAGKKSGSLGDIGVFSFHGSKTMTTGEGGMLVTNDEKLYKRCLFLRDHGRVPGDVMFKNEEVAYKYKMSSMQAALGLAQIERVEELVAKKREIFSWYKEELTEVSGITLNCEKENVRNTYWMISIILDAKLGIKKEKLMAHLKEKNIDSRPFFHPLSSIPAYFDLPQAKQAREENRISYELSPYAINLPSGLDMTQEKVKRVCDEIKNLLVDQ